MTQHEELQKKRAQQTLWKRGQLEFLFDETQLQMRAAFRESEARKYIFLCSRRLGKSYLLCGIACEEAVKRPIKIIYITSDYKAAKNIVQPIIAKLLDTCPPSLRPVFKTQDMKYVFPNGSQLFLFGADRAPDSIRGQEADLVLIDEAGFVNNLRYLISSVLTPMLLMTNGRILMGTTPPKSTDHDFMRYLEEAEVDKSIIKKTIFDCPRVTPKMMAEFMAEAGGSESDTWKREYLIQSIQDAETAVFPEWTEDRQAIAIQELPRAPYADLYVGMDLGFVDDTAVVFGWWDFVNARLVIEDELIIKRETTNNIALRVRAKEAELWKGGEPYKRIADNNNQQLLFDLSSLHGLSFQAAQKHYSKESGINKTRLMIASGQIVINPRCVNLNMQLKYCRWKGGQRVTFERSDSFGHYDLCDALVILANHIHRGRNPVVDVVDIHSQYLGNVRYAPNPIETIIPRQLRTPPQKIKRFR